MRTAGLMMNDVWADRVLRERGVETYRFEGLSAEIGVLVDTVELRHHGKDVNYRPYLHLSGELRSVTPVEGLPYGISQVTYSAGQGEKVDAFYEFDDQQMVVLASKGYFGNAFVVPQQITGIEWELPTTVDALVLAPSGMESDAPVVFTRVHDIANLEVNLGSSGYDLTDYFADHAMDGVSRAEASVDERSLRARSDAINSLFSEDDFDLVDQAEQGAQRLNPAAQDTPVADGLSESLQAVEAQIGIEAEQFRAELERTEGTPESLYRNRVASTLPHDEEPTVPPRPSQTPVTNPAPEAEPELVHGDDTTGASGLTLDERKREVARRAADLDFGDDGEQSLGA